MVAQFSAWLYGAADGVYVLALVFLLVEQAWGRHSVAATVGRRRETRQLLGAGGAPHGTSGEAGDEPSSSVDVPDGRGADRAGRAELSGRMGLALVVLGFALHATSLLTRAVEPVTIPV